jgi:flagellar motor protein MotB
MDTDDGFALDVWPAFSDLMLSVILLMILLIGIIHATQLVVDPGVITKQAELINRLKTPESEIEQLERRPAHWVIRSGNNKALEIDCSIDPQNPFLQKISFSDQLLFDPDKTDLKNAGTLVLSRLAKALSSEGSSVIEIQVHGHADPQKSRHYRDNLELASNRANEVFRYLTEHGLDPFQSLISAASFGEYLPRQRIRGNSFDSKELLRANETDVMRQMNRRIEVLLFYRTRRTLKSAKR